MRQIKFRAWDSKSKVMIPNITLAGLKNWENVNYYDWMQFTGLFDKTGKEIYEGDVIRDQYMGIENEIIEFGDATFFARGLESGKHKGFSDKIEVIGNVWEHPNLIK